MIITIGFTHRYHEATIMFNLFFRTNTDIQVSPYKELDCCKLSFVICFLLIALLSR